jgi:hypothetical protein
MSILSAYIYKRVITGITRRDDIDVEYFNGLLLEACNEIALRTGYLRAVAAGDIDSDTGQAVGPTDMLSDSSVETFKLKDRVLDPMSYEEWEQDVKRGYAVYNGTIYVRPTRNADKSYTMYYNRTHEAIGLTLEFPDIYQPAIVQLSASKVYGDKELQDKEEYRRQKFEDELAKLPNVNVGISHGRGSNDYYG